MGAKRLYLPCRTANDRGPTDRTITMSELDGSSTDALHWAEQFCKTCEEQDIKFIEPDFLAGWFANFWAAVHDPLQTQIESLKSENEKYDELIMAVQKKHPDESRHQTALRYIRQAEKSTNQCAKADG